MLRKNAFTKTGTVAALAVSALWGLSLTAGPAGISSARAADSTTTVSPGLIMPTFDPVNGKALFASKGCVVCHSVNGVGGTDAPAIDSSVMEPEMNPFDFVAKMWNHSQGMIAMQLDEMGHQIEFDNGQQIADIIAFLHDVEEQKTFTEDDIPPDIVELMDSGMEHMDSGTEM